jgi:hypothetical protein
MTGASLELGTEVLLRALFIFSDGFLPEDSKEGTEGDLPLAA